MRAAQPGNDYLHRNMSYCNNMSMSTVFNRYFKAMNVFPHIPHYSLPGSPPLRFVTVHKHFPTSPPHHHHLVKLVLSRRSAWLGICNWFTIILADQWLVANTSPRRWRWQVMIATDDNAVFPSYRPSLNITWPKNGAFYW